MNKIENKNIKEFDKDYYENGINTGKSLYLNYRWLPELSIPMAFRIIEELGITESHTVLDYGCAKGYMVKAFRMLYRNAYGVDVSTYAIESADEMVKSYVQLIKEPEDILFLKLGTSSFDFAIAKDVFEHIPPTILVETLKRLRKVATKLFVVVPLGDGERYYEPAYEIDKTHIIREDVKWWKKTFTKTGFHVERFDYNIKGIKDKWIQKCKTGNGMFLLV